MQELPQQNCLESIKLGFVNYCNFSGRARRSEFFYFFCTMYWISEILLITYIIEVFANGHTETDYYGTTTYYAGTAPFGLTLSVYLFEALTFIPKISSSARRLHDTGRSGWYYLVVFIPIVGIFIFLSFVCQDSEANTNEYGPSPKFVQPQGAVVPPGTAYLPPPVVTVTAPAVVAVPVGQYNQPPVQPMPYQQPNPMQPNIYSQPNPIQPQASPGYNY
jgi:uncharacterized membrane protein YhaH (DUF805 family)